MANIKSAKKRAKQTVVRNARNTSQRSMLRTLVKKVVKALETKDLVAAEAAFVELLARPDPQEQGCSPQEPFDCSHQGIESRLISRSALQKKPANAGFFIALHS